MEKLYIKREDIKEFNNVNELIESLYSTDHPYGFPVTYSKKDCTSSSKTCKAGAARSFGDILRIVRTYYPKTSQRELMRILYASVYSGNRKFIYCDSVNKIVINTGSWDSVPEKILIPNVFYDYGWIIRDNETAYADKFTFDYLFAKIGYTKEELVKIKRGL